MRLFATNVRLVLIALVLAVSVWVSAVTADDPNEVRTPLEVPLETVGQDTSLIITSEIPETVQVTLRAPRSVWDQLTAQEQPVRAILDLSNLSAGAHAIEPQIQITDRPVQIVLSNPAVVAIQLERRATRVLPVDLSLSGQPAVGYQAGDAAIDPFEIIVSGPEPIVDQAARARVRVSLDGVREGIDQAIPVQILDSKNAIIEELSINPDEVHVSIPVSQQGGFRDVAVKVVVSGQVAAGYRLENISVVPPVITVFSTNPDLVDALLGVVETLPLDLQGAQDDISAKLALALPPGITIVGEQNVEVQVGVSPIQTSLTLVDQLINIDGLSTGRTAQVSLQTVDVIISGPLPVLDALTTQDIIVTVDVTDLDVGTYQLPLTVEVLVDNVVVESILPGTVEVVISIPGTPTRTP